MQLSSLASPISIFVDLVRDQISRKNFEAFMSGFLFHKHEQSSSSESVEENFNDYPYPFPCFNLGFGNFTKVDFADFISNKINIDKLVEFLKAVRHVHVQNDSKSKSKSVGQEDEEFLFSFPCFHLSEDEDFNREDYIKLLEQRFSRFTNNYKDNKYQEV